MKTRNDKVFGCKRIEVYKITEVSNTHTIQRSINKDIKYALIAL